MSSTVGRGERMDPSARDVEVVRQEVGELKPLFKAREEPVVQDHVKLDEVFPKPTPHQHRGESSVHMGPVEQLPPHVHPVLLRLPPELKGDVSTLSVSRDPGVGRLVVSPRGV